MASSRVRLWLLPFWWAWPCADNYYRIGFDEEVMMSTGLTVLLGICIVGILAGVIYMLSGKKK